MFKYRFDCANEERIRAAVEQSMRSDLPCGKSLLGGDLYGPGVHFQECGEVIKGFYLDASEAEAYKGSLIRVRFRGSFVRHSDNRLFFETYIYPCPSDILFWLCGLIFSLFCNIMAVVVYSLILLFFAKCYCDMINETRDIFRRIFR